jgi:hypothetical protein
VIEEIERLMEAATPRPWVFLYEEAEIESAEAKLVDGSLLDEARLDPCAIGAPNRSIVIDDEDYTGLLQPCDEIDAEEDRANLRLAHAAVNALPTWIALAKAAQAWADADNAGRAAARGEGDLIEALATMEAAEAQLHAAVAQMGRAES